MKLCTVIAILVLSASCWAAGDLSGADDRDNGQTGYLGAGLTSQGQDNGLNVLYGTSRALKGIASGPTEAEKLQKKEEDFQKQLAGLVQVVDGLKTRMADMRKQVSPPIQEDLDRLETELALCDQQLDSMAMQGQSPLAQLEQSELRDRLFQMHIESDTMKRRWKGTWSVFGLDFFQSTPSIQSTEASSAPSSYRLRVGDKLTVTTLSTLGAQNEYPVKVEKNGTIAVPGAGKVVVAGMSIKQLTAELDSRIRSKFKQLKVGVRLESLSTMQIQVSGEVARPGTFTLNGMATVFAALYRAGGPTKSGTLRRVSLVRGSENPRTIDLYDFLMNGSKKQDVPLEDGDLIFVPPVGKTITIGGEVIRPGRYEPDFPINLGQALAMAGGAKSGGYLQTVQVERIEKSEYKTLLSTPISAVNGQSTFKLQPGDEITLTSVREDKTNQVSVNGLVSAPGFYGFKDGMRVADLIKLAQGLSQDKGVYLGRADVLRVDPVKGTELVTFNLEKALQADPVQNVELHKLDRVFIYSPNQVVFKPTLVTINGAVSTPGIYRRSDGMHVADAIAAAGGITPQAFLTRADLLRHKQGNTTELVRVDLQAALSGDPLANVDLQDRDELTIYTQDQAGWRDRTVRIEGAVQRGGLYKRSEKMRVSDLLFDAGGLIPEAGQMAEVARCVPSGKSEITRVDLSKLTPAGDGDVVLQDGDVVTIASVNPHLRAPEVVYITGEVAKPGPYVLLSRDDKLSDVLARAGGLTDSANIHGMLFLRPKESSQNAQQERDAGLVLTKSRLFADKQFVVQLGKMGVNLPPGFQIANSATTEKLAKPEQVLQTERSTNNTNAEPELSHTQDQDQQNGDTNNGNNVNNQNPAQDRERKIYRDGGANTDSNVSQDDNTSADDQTSGIQGQRDVNQSNNGQNQGQMNSDDGNGGNTAGARRQPKTPDAELTPSQINKILYKPAKSKTKQAGMDIGTQTKDEPASAFGPPLMATRSAMSSAYLGDRSALLQSDRISINLTRALREPSSPDNLGLRNGDRIFIPRGSNVVEVIGSVLHPHSFAAGPGKTADYYIKRSGGYSQDASKGAVIVVRANGDALPATAVKSVNPGDIIVVPSTGLIDVTKKWERTGSVTKVISDILSSVYVLTRF